MNIVNGYSQVTGTNIFNSHMLMGRIQTTADLRCDIGGHGPPIFLYLYYLLYNFKYIFLKINILIYFIYLIF